MAFWLEISGRAASLTTHLKLNCQAVKSFDNGKPKAHEYRKVFKSRKVFNALIFYMKV